MSVIVEGVSQQATTPNGDNHPPSADPIDNATLLARLEICISRSTEAKEAAAEARDLVADVKRVTTRLASDHFELRTGIPSSWSRRLVLAGLAATIGAITGGAVALSALRMILVK